MTNDGEAVTWRLAEFNELSAAELYAILRLRQLVFVVEQICPYLDADGHDAEALHLSGWRASDDGEELVAYARIFAPGSRGDDASIGRVVVAPEERGVGLGRALMHEALAHVETMWGRRPIVISAQRYLERFYHGLGFEVVGEPYDEDGIPHVAMRRP